MTWTGGWWLRIEDSGGGSSTGRQRRVATLTPEIRETGKRERVFSLHGHFVEYMNMHAMN